MKKDKGKIIIVANPPSIAYPKGDKLVILLPESKEEEDLIKSLKMSLEKRGELDIPPDSPLYKILKEDGVI